MPGVLRTLKPLRRSSKALKIIVEDTAGLKVIRPVTGGVPLPRGSAPPGAAFVLKNAKGSRVPLQTKVLARWKDGSARWLLLDFAADPPAKGKSEYQLTWSRSAKHMPPPKPLRVRRGASPAITSDLVRVESSDKAVFRLNDAFDVSLRMTDSRGRIHSGVVSRTRIETAGRLRSALLFEGDLKDKSGERAFSFRMRVTAFAGASRIRLEPMIIVDADKGAVQPIRELRLEVHSLNGEKVSGAIGGKPGWRGGLTKKSAVRLFQVDDKQYRIEGARGRGKRAPGWAELSSGQVRLAICLRDFWQQWPKSIEFTRDSASFGLFPRFKRGDFDHMQPWSKYGYLFRGACYQLKTGQARRWEIWIDAVGSGERLCKLANAPAVPVADPQQAVATGVWGGILPAGSPESETYDAWADTFCDAFIRSIEINRDYGAMNWGDWYGERGCNWGNNEYDTGNQLLIAFARTGNPRYFHAAEAHARHMSEVDVIHAVNPDLVNSFPRYAPFPIRRGCVHEHCLGHVGGFCSTERVRRLLLSHGVGRGRKSPHLCLQPRNLGHVWSDGMVRLYFLTGDAWIRETIELVAGHVAQLVKDRKYRFMDGAHCGRGTGWPLLLLAAAYEIGYGTRYLRAMKTLVNDALAEQDPNCGGWIYRLPQGHCNCVKEKHVGMAEFITSILINGLARYYDVTGDARIPEAVHRATDNLIRDCWVDEKAAWRHTSCPASIVRRLSLPILAVANSIRLSSSLSSTLRLSLKLRPEGSLTAEGKRDEEQARVFRKAFSAALRDLPKADPRAPYFARGFALAILGTAEAAALMHAIASEDSSASPREEKSGV